MKVVLNTNRPQRLIIDRGMIKNTQVLCDDLTWRMNSLSCMNNVHVIGEASIQSEFWKNTTADYVPDKIPTPEIEK